MKTRLRSVFRCLGGVALLMAALLTAASGARAQNAAQAPAAASDWVVYSTEVGWLRVGPRAEFDAKWKRKDEINGGTGEELLAKSLLAQGFLKRDDALAEVCPNLTRVHLRIVPPTACGPARFVTAIYRGKEYSLRLASPLSEEEAIAEARTGKAYKALEYNFDGELQILTKFRITPRFIFDRKQWLVHSIGRGSVDGPVKEDRWMCVTSEPALNEKGEKYVVLADGFGGTVTHGLKESEGPFLDNYTLAKVMKRYRVEKVDLWPPVSSSAGRDVQPRVETAVIPEAPKDHGDRALPTQPRVTDPRLLDWVIYVVENQWLHLGTRYEFERPMTRAEVLWSGNGQEPAKKQILLPRPGTKEVFYSRRQALRALCGDLSELAWAYHPQNQPRETVVARYRGQPLGLRLERGGDPDSTLEQKYGAYDAAGTIAALRLIDPGLTPRKYFNPKWLVHATGHGTVNGPVKDDLWLTISSAPDAGKRSFVLPDGMGGTFGYSYDQGFGPFTESYTLAAALRQIAQRDPRLKSVGIWSEDRSVSVTDIPVGVAPVDRGRPTQPGTITLKKILPGAAEQGQTLGITILGSNLEPGCRITLGTGIVVKDPTYLGRDSDSALDQWVATLEIARDAPLGKRPLAVYNSSGGDGSLADAFEIGEGDPGLCDPIELVIPAGAREWISAATRDDAVTADMPEADRQPYIRGLQQRRQQLFGALIEMESARDNRASLVKDLKRVVRELTPLDPKNNRDEYRSKLIERSAISSRIRAEEASYARGMTYLADTFTEEEFQKLSRSLRERAACLGPRVRDAFDEGRKWSYTAYWEDWRLRNRAYQIQRDDMLHCLRLWQGLNATRQGKLLRLLDEARIAQVASTGRISNPAALRPYQRALRDAHLDAGLCGLHQAHTLMEDGMLAQESYLAGYRSTDKSAQGLEEAKEISRRAEQAIVYAMKYALALGGDAFGAVTDSAKRIFNAGIGELTGGQLETVSSRLTTAIAGSREKLDLSLKGLARLRGYTDEQSAALKSRDVDGDAALTYLGGDLNFFLQTSGGLRRIGACYDLSYSDMLESEHAIAVERARRSAADMRRTFNAMRGAESDDSYTNWRKALINPFGVMKVLLQGTSFGGDQFTGTELYLQNRESEATELQNLGAPMRLVNWDPIQLRSRAPGNYALYLSLRQNNPHALEWDLTRDHLATRARLEHLERLLFLASENNDRDQIADLQQFRQRNLHYLGAQRPESMARCLQLQACDRLMTWDYDGALELFYQASEISEKVQPRAKVEALREELTVRKTREARLEVIFSLGDSIFMQRLYQGIGDVTALGLHRAGLLRRRPISPAPEAPKGFLSKPIPYMAWADVVWGVVNPFKDLVGAVAVERELAAVAKAGAGIGSAVTQEIATQVTKTAAMDWFNVKQEYADFLANALVNTATAQQPGGDALIVELAKGLRAASERYTSASLTSFNTFSYGERQTARRSLSRFWTYLNQLRDFRAVTESLHGKSLVGKPPAEVKTATDTVAASETRLTASLEPLTTERAKERLKVVAEAADPAVRLTRIAEFFKDHPILASGGPVRDLVRALRKEKNPEAETLNEQIDEMRWELITHSMQDFVAKNPRFAAMFVDYVFIGAAANKNGKAYRDKKSLTDVDFTALLKETVSNTERKEFETAFNSWFEAQHKLTLEHLDVSVMGDFRPEFHPELESTTRLLFEREPAKLERLKQFLERDAEKVRTDAFHSERYYEQGNILFLNLGLKICGNLKKAERQGNELTNEPPEKAAEFFKGITLEPWMAFDVAIGQLGFLMRHKEPSTDAGVPTVDARGALVLKDPVAYHKYLCKYPGARGLFGMLLLSAKGRERLSSLTRDDAAANGWESMEEVVNHVAREMVSKHGLQELGLVPPPGLDAGAAREHYLAMFDMWLLSKGGTPREVVAARLLIQDLGRPARADDLRPLSDPAQVDSILTEHARRTEGFLRNLVSRSLLTQSTEMKKLENAATDARKEGTPEGMLRAQVLEAQIKRVFFRLASTWFRMKREVQGPVLREALELVLREAPSEADFLYAIAAVENLGPRVAKPDGSFDPAPLAVWQPQVFSRDNDALNGLVDQLRAKARDDNTPRLFDSRLRAALD